MTAKDLRVAAISSRDGNAIIQKLHYSHKTVKNSQLHLGVFLGTRLEGAMQFGPSLDRRKLLGLVEGTSWNGFLELNRLAFSDNLPRNSESRALGVALRLIRRQYPQIDWIVSFADATQCGDGTIYRAAGFVLDSHQAQHDALGRAGWHGDLERRRAHQHEEDPGDRRAHELQGRRGHGPLQGAGVQAAGGLPVAIHLLHEPSREEAADGSGRSVFRDWQGRRCDGSRQARR